MQVVSREKAVQLGARIAATAELVCTYRSRVFMWSQRLEEQGPGNWEILVRTGFWFTTNAAKGMVNDGQNHSEYVTVYRY